jgi:hypothetical protein
MKRVWYVNFDYASHSLHMAGRATSQRDIWSVPDIGGNRKRSGVTGVAFWMAILVRAVSQVVSVSLFSVV